MEPTHHTTRPRHHLVTAVIAALTLIAGLGLVLPSASAQPGVLFTGNLSNRPVTRSITSGSGTVDATLTLSRAAGATLTLVDSSGTQLASVSGSSGTLSLSPTVTAGAFELSVVGTGSWKGRIKFELAVSYPDAQGSTSTSTTSTSTTSTSTTSSTTSSTTPSTTPTPTPGAVYEIPASIAGDCSVDVTAALNSWIRSVPDGSAGAPNVLRFGSGRCYRVDGTLVNPREDISSPERHHLVFDGNGSTLDGRYYVVPPETATKINHSMWMFGHAVDITVQNFTMQGQHPNACNIDASGNCRDGGAVGPYEWYAGVAFEGGQDLVVRYNQIYNMYGDGVNISQGSRCWQGTGVWGADHPVNVLVESNLIDGTGRHGVSISAGEHVRVVGNTFDRISYQLADLEYECAQPVRDITFDRNVIRRHYLGFIASTTGGEYHQCPPEGFNGGYVITNNIMERSGVTTTPPIWVASTQTSYCTVNDKADVRVEGNTLLYDHAEGSNSAIQVDTTSGTIAIRNNRIVQPGTAAAVKLTRVSSATKIIRGNDMRESSYAYWLDGVAHAPGVDACGNTTSGGANLPSWCG